MNLNTVVKLPSYIPKVSSTYPACSKIRDLNLCYYLTHGWYYKGKGGNCQNVMRERESLKREGEKYDKYSVRGSIFFTRGKEEISKF